MLMPPFFITGAKLTNLQLIDDNSSSDASSVVVPSDVREGDLLIVCNMAVKTSIVATTVPSGFTKILPTTSVAYAAAISGTTYYWHMGLGYKIATGTEGSSTLNSMSFTGSVNPGSAMMVAVFRGNRKITGVTVRDNQLDGHVSSAVTNTITSGSGTPALLPMAWYTNLGTSWSSTSQRAFTPTPDDEVIFGVSNMALRWKFYGENETPENIACSMAAASQHRILESCYLELEAE